MVSVFMILHEPQIASVDEDKIFFIQHYVQKCIIYDLLPSSGRPATQKFQMRGRLAASPTADPSLK